LPANPAPVQRQVLKQVSGKTCNVTFRICGRVFGKPVLRGYEGSKAMINMAQFYHLNFLFQALLLIVLFAGIGYARRHKVPSHCKIMKVAAFVQVLLIIFFMYPAMQRPDVGLAVFLHHVTGLVAVLLAVYIWLVFSGKLRERLDRMMAMKLTVVFWVFSYLMGIYIS
jgi:putative membrane protein